MRRFHCFSYSLIVGLIATVCVEIPSAVAADRLLVEAESFAEHGGWKLDTQFINVMGSPYLLAHGLGSAVSDATTEVKFPSTGQYKVYVRTKDWVAPWNAPGTPGKFQVLINGNPIGQTFGTDGADWHWEAGGQIEISEPSVTISLGDLTGFDGRCDAIYFTKGDELPSNDSSVLPAWRREALGLDANPQKKAGYDLVVIGGGYSGMGAALSAARAGCKVALIQDRPVLGGNGSSEVRVWSQGLLRRGPYPRVGEIMAEICDSASKSPGTFEEFEDAKKEAIVRAEPNIDLFLNHHAYQVETDGNRITGVLTLDTRTSEVTHFSGRNFVDCTGHGTIGFLAGADWDMTPKGRMGMSNMWAWDEAEQQTTFPETPWALPLKMDDFPYPRDHHGQWFWEGGFDKDPIAEAELIRDWNFRAVFGAFNAMKNGDGADKHKNAYLTWVAFIGGPRESRRLMGDVVLTQDNIVTKKQFKDGCVPTTWSIDLHYPKEQYAKKFPDNPFISIAVHDRRIDRSYGYPVPYRCFYSRNIENLFMAGRCASVTHEALGTVRVMRTCGMMGEVVGKAAAICATKDCSPRDVYRSHWAEMEQLLQLPGKAHRAGLNETFEIPKEAMPLAASQGSPHDERKRVGKQGINPTKLAGIVIDDKDAKKTGKWENGSGLPGYVGDGYLYANRDATIQYDFVSPADGRFKVSIAYQPHENRGKNVPVEVTVGDEVHTTRVDMTKKPAQLGFFSLGVFPMQANVPGSVTIGTDGAEGTVHADAVQIVRLDP